jgi:FHA domain
MQAPYIRIEDSGVAIPLREDVTTIGRGSWVDVHLGDPSVSRLHAEIVRRGPYAYVTDLGLSRNGTRVNGRLVARRVLQDGDVLTFGSARCRIGGLGAEDCVSEVELRRPSAPELTRREHDVVTSLCRPALSDEAFVAPATAREIAADLVVTEAAVKQHLLRLYQKFRIPEGANRRVRLANEVVALGLVRPLPPTEQPEEITAVGGLPAVPPLPVAPGHSGIPASAAAEPMPAPSPPPRPTPPATGPESESESESESAARPTAATKMRGAAVTVPDQAGQLARVRSACRSA